MGTSPSRMLIVEDDPALVELMRTAARGSFEILAVKDSGMAVAVIHEQAFAGIFLDLNLSWIDSFSLASQIRTTERNARTAIVVLTSWRDFECMRRAYAAGATFFLYKPVTPARVGRIMRAIAGSIAGSSAPPECALFAGTQGHRP